MNFYRDYQIDKKRYPSHLKLSLLQKCFLINYRLGNELHYSNGILKSKILKKLVSVPYQLLSILLGLDIPFSCKIGVGFRPIHLKGLVFNPRAKIGENVTVLHDVTIGAKSIGDPFAPSVGDGVFIGAGAKIIGHISIGANAKIGANAVVYRDVHSHQVVVSKSEYIIK